MIDFFQRIVEIPPPFNMVVLIVLIVTAGSIVKGIAKYLR